MKRILIFFIFITKVLSATFDYEINATSNVTDMELIGEVLYICTDANEVDVYNINSKKFLNPIKIPKIKTYFGDEVDAKIFGFDKIGNLELLLSQGDYGKKDIFLINNDKKEKITLKNQSIFKAKFLDDKNILLASLSNEIYIFDIQKRSIIYTHKFSTSALSDIKLSDDRKILYLACESGKIYIFDLINKKLINTINAHNDNIYKIEVANNKIISGSTDKFVGIWDINSTTTDELANLSNGWRKESSFLVYCVGISKDAKFFAYMSDENSDVEILNDKFQKVDELKTNQSVINKIIFINDKKIITSAYEKTIKFWSIK